MHNNETQVGHPPSNASSTWTLASANSVHDEEGVQLLEQHLTLLRKPPSQYTLPEITTTPIFVMPILRYAETLLSPDDPRPFPQYGLLGGLSEVLEAQEESGAFHSPDPRILFNVASPSSTFICGSQGSGKSHTLSCLLENCLSNSRAGRLPSPLTGLVFHYDTFISDHGGSPCEAAFLTSDPEIKVKVLCSPTNLSTIRNTYRHLNVVVEPLQIKESDLNTKRMLELMAVKSGEQVPLYIHTIYRILREMRIMQQECGTQFNYREFKSQVTESGLAPGQIIPLQQRLDALESFMPKTQVYLGKKGKNKSLLTVEHDWSSKPGHLTIVDLSCPCVTPETACSLFNICLSLFVEQSMDLGRVIALDEAHKFMDASPEALTLTNTLLSVIRLQRHLGARIVISTQEPTISPLLLDLCSTTIVHRFTSPGWMHAIRSHLAGGTEQEPENETGGDSSSYEKVQKGKTSKIFDEIVKLRVGHALLFCPAAMIGLTRKNDGETETERLGSGYLKIRIRNRLTTDGGRSVMAT
ncbi:hypothetical protein ONS95_000769 [Cadophora gregata]|uniref:uncharacterized protein n=1 Tax=Cadophora gregata TaxID=51156 RepID=UPI0026DC5F96|nr:uncharacterized protein ONS95_000769 [Cadophora gregata]KAK0103054.1 hypothetical protein ONS96_005665 [Cadophora gregata f. sp. sojae]KAK0128819.1 hypothetical protein ONS95_000769 [Cadophora gregata]